jgi:hypothetical protein
LLLVGLVVGLLKTLNFPELGINMVFEFRNLLFESLQVMNLEFSLREFLADAL